jgi:hypothetical protein
MITTQTHDLDTAKAAAKKSADEAFDTLPNTEPERSEHADGLDTIPGAWYQNEMEWLKNELGREPTSREEEAYREAWEGRIEERKEEAGIA